jgi:quinol monooxygenase YgiN
MHFLRLILVMAGLGLATVRPVNAEEPVNNLVYAVTYFEVAPATAGQAAGLAREYAEASRKEAGNVAFDMLTEIGRPNRLAVLQAWRDKAALDAHVAAPSTAALRDKLQPLLISGTMPRLFSGFAVAPPTGKPGPDAVFVLTHVDVPPPQKDQAIELQKALVAAARKDDGNLWFDVLQQSDPRTNHFTLFEAWRDRKAFDASIAAAHTKEFRQKLNPLEGALYDERLYQPVR